MLEVGQEVKVKVINIDREKRRIGLSMRALQEDPWTSRVQKFSVGQLVEGVITRLTKFGAFARLEGDIEGLIHISEISEHRIEHPKEALKEGEVKTLRTIRIDPDQHRIGLSLRKVDSAAFADKDFKMLAEEFHHESEEEAPVETPMADEPEVSAAPVEMPEADAPEAPAAPVEMPEADAPEAPTAPTEENNGESA
jgi:small subunit ribosomal protein S1